jgi:hypothetical protein
MKYLLSDIEFRTFEKGISKGKEYVVATVSNAECDVDTRSTRVAILAVPAVIAKWKKLVEDNKEIIREGQFFTVSDLPTFYKKEYDSENLISSNGVPIPFNSLQVFSFLAPFTDPNTGAERMAPVNDVRNEAMRMIRNLFQLAPVGGAEAHSNQTEPPHEEEVQIPEGFTAEQWAIARKAMGK